MPLVLTPKALIDPSREVHHDAKSMPHLLLFDIRCFPAIDSVIKPDELSLELSYLSDA